MHDFILLTQPSPTREGLSQRQQHWVKTTPLPAAVFSLYKTDASYLDLRALSCGSDIKTSLCNLGMAWR